jgi:hypothetical protein
MLRADQEPLPCSCANGRSAPREGKTVQQELIRPQDAAPHEGVDARSDVEADLGWDDGPDRLRPTRMPVGRRGQLRALRRQLVWCDHAVRTCQREADRAMRDPDADDGQRWQAVRSLRALSWKVCREVLPLVSRVPPALQAEPEFVECQRAAHALRRTTESALRTNTGYTVDLIAAERDPVLPR